MIEVNMDPNTKIFVGGLPSGSKPHELRRVFEGFGIVTECEIMNRCGFVHMETPFMVEKAIQALHNTFFKGSKITVERGRGKNVNSNEGGGRDNGPHSQGHQYEGGNNTAMGDRESNFGNNQYAGFESQRDARGGGRTMSNNASYDESFPPLTSGSANYTRPRGGMTGFDRNSGSNQGDGDNSYYNQRSDVSRFNRGRGRVFDDNSNYNQRGDVSRFHRGRGGRVFDDNSNYNQRGDVSRFHRGRGGRVFDGNSNSNERGDVSRFHRGRGRVFDGNSDSNQRGDVSRFHRGRGRVFDGNSDSNQRGDVSRYHRGMGGRVFDTNQ